MSAAGGRGAGGRRGSLALALAVALLAILPRLGPALRAYNHSPDAAEYLLIARSLARGEGFVLPIRVRFAAPGPVVHEAYGERAPLWPWLLAPVVGALGAEPGWPDPRLQLVNVALAALAAGLATLLGWELARAHRLRGSPRALAALLAGLLVAWQPGGVRASVHLWAEPLGLALVLGAALLAWPRARTAPRAGAAELALALGAGLLAGLARFARPEGWVLPLVLAFLGWRRGERRAAGVLLAAAALVNVLGVALTGVLAPQLELFEVARYEATMAGPGAPPPTAGQVAGGLLANAWGQLEYALVPRRGLLILPLALLALRSAAARQLALAAAALALATIAVWSTADPARFTIAPLALLAPPAAVGAIVGLARLRRRVASPRARRALLAGGLGAWLALAGYAGTREGRKPLRTPEPLAAPPLAASEPPALADPWRHALRTGRPAVLARPAD